MNIIGVVFIAHIGYSQCNLIPDGSQFFHANHIGDIRIFPVPSSGGIYLEVPDTMLGSTAAIVDLTGRVIASFIIHSNISSIELPVGFYVLEIRGEHKNVLRKITTFN